MTPQHMQALEMANSIRSSLSEVKRDVRRLPPRGGAELVADVVEHDYADRAIGRMRLDYLLLCVQGMGSTKMIRCLRTAGVEYHGKRLNELTPRQRDAVALQLRLWASLYAGGR